MAGSAGMKRAWKARQNRLSPASRHTGGLMATLEVRKDVQAATEPHCASAPVQYWACAAHRGSIMRVRAFAGCSRPLGGVRA